MIQSIKYKETNKKSSRLISVDSRLLLLLAVILPFCLWFACQRQAASESISTVDQNDQEILRIAQEARAGLPIFFRHLTRPETGESHFSVKYPFTAVSDCGVNTEQIWLMDIRFRNGRYYGMPANTPVHAFINKSEAVHFLADEITDWMFIRDGKIIGGQSIKYLLERIPEEQRTGRQNSLLLMFED